MSIIDKMRNNEIKNNGNENIFYYLHYNNINYQFLLIQNYTMIKL
jgi:hypothetical protein